MHARRLIGWHQVKAARVEHGKKSFGPVLVDQLYGYVLPTICPLNLLNLIA